MIRFACLILGAVALPLLSSIPAAAVLSGDYTVYLRHGPTHQRAGSFCITFTNTGNIDGFPDSGTWTASGNTNGNFVVDGKRLRWYGLAVTNGGDEAINGYNAVENDVPGKGGYDVWLASNPPTAEDDGTTDMKAGCS